MADKVETQHICDACSVTEDMAQRRLCELSKPATYGDIVRIEEILYEILRRTPE